MRSLNRNKRQLWYANLEDSSDVVNDAGYETGESDDSFEQPPKSIMVNVSAATGQAAAEAFGAFTDYSRTVSTCDMGCDMQEGSRVWFGVDPFKEGQSHNYVVVRRADSINSLLFALKEVTIS